ncbi:hypothetical protein FSP39_020158 [Pinctada imbricata]|uniref:Condensin-2 complex subunit H2 n=1 Tax=Pinctada imbricata TaxID=66713 RepID=A0AA88YEY7_PINIB|nr:hypothetical protein FSP39_020158 [Pinctada imbricata]
MPANSSGELDTRFASLLQPIRDLTKNWDVDIAYYLEDYLEELGSIEVTFDGGLTTMNFAEAAMLIQGSVCVYSKKVEYLYSLVCQVLDLLASKKKQGKSSVDDKGNDEDVTGFNDKNADEEFLSLDDIQEHRNIVVKEDDLGHKAVMPIPRMPLSLIPLEDGEKGDNPLLSKKGEVLASRNDFRLNTCSVHATGTLLLDMSHMNLLQKILQGSDSSVQALSTIQEADTEMLDACRGVSKEAECILDIKGGNDMSVDDHDNMFEPLTGDMDGDIPQEESAHNTLQSEQPEVRRSERRKIQVVQPKPVIDPWKCLDPHDPGSVVERKLKKGKNYSIPKVIEEETENGRKKRKRTKVGIKLPPLYEFTNNIYMNTSKMTKSQRRQLEFEELDRCYWEELKRRHSIMKSYRKKMVNDNADDGDDEDDGLAIPGLIDDKLFDAIDNADYAETSYHHNDHNHNGNFSPVDQGEFITDYEELVKKHVDQYMASAQEYAQITELSKRVAEWEEKVIPRLEEEDRHEPFDINRYGSLVLGTLPKGTLSNFQKVVVNKPTYEVCRIFLATLMLANTRNVDIKCKEGKTISMDDFQLSLLSTKRHFEQLEEYQAPSIATKT